MTTKKINPPPYLITKSNIIVTFDHKTFRIQASQQKKFDTVKKLIAKQDWVALEEFLVPAHGVVTYTEGNFEIRSDRKLYLVGSDIPSPEVLGKRILEFKKEGLPYLPLLSFLKNIQKNPDPDSVEQLYEFLEANHHPITPDGCFIAYKKITQLADGRFVDSHTKKIDNSIGTPVKMNRKDVVKDPNVSCAQGLHVAAFTYAKSYSGNVLVEVKVNPMHVVSVPYDYSQQKMRTCQYIVLGEMEKDEARKEHYCEEYETIDSDNTDEEVKPIEPKVKSASANMTIDISKLSAREIVDLVYQKIGIKIAISLKSKKSIINKAVELLDKSGYKVVAASK